MSTVILFPKHRLYKCSRDDPGCSGCFICEGGLGLCMTCGGAEASMPTDCPQRQMSAREQTLIQKGEIDFREGRWTTPASWKSLVGDK